MSKIKKPKKPNKKYFNAGSMMSMGTSMMGGFSQNKQNPYGEGNDAANKADAMGEGIVDAAKNIPIAGQYIAAVDAVSDMFPKDKSWGRYAAGAIDPFTAGVTGISIAKNHEDYGISKGKGIGLAIAGFTGLGGLQGKVLEKAQRNAENEQARKSRFEQGTLFSKEGGILPSSEYKILPSNKSSKKAPIQKLTKDMEIVSQSGQFSHNSNDDIPVDTNNDNQEDLRMEGGEIILKQKDGGQYMLNAKISKVLKPKALALSKGDKISQNTLEKYLKPNAIKANDANLASKGLTDRLSMVNGGSTTKPTVTLSPTSYNKLAQNKPVMSPQEYQKYLIDTNRTPVKTYTQGTPNKGFEVKKHGGKVKPSKYYDAGKFQGEYEPGELQEAMSQRTLSFSPNSLTGPMTNRDFRRTQQKTNQINYNNQDIPNLPKFEPTLPTDNTNYSLKVPGRESLMSKSKEPKENTSGSFKSQQPWGSIATQLAGTGLKALALKRHKTLPVKSEFISNELARKQGKAEEELLGAENESIQRVQGSVNKALDSTSYPSVQARLANMRNTIKGGASAEADVRSKYALGRSGLMSQNAATLAGVKSQNYFAQNDREQQNIDNKTNQWTKVAQDISNIGINSGYLMNGKRYNDAVMNSGDSVVYNQETGEQEFNSDFYGRKRKFSTKVTYGGKIKKPKKLK